MHPPIVKLTPDAEPETPEPHQLSPEGSAIVYVFPTSQAVLGSKVAVKGHNGAIHLGMVTGANTDGTLTLVVFAHQQFDGQVNESLMGVHFRNNVPPSEVTYIA